MSHDSETAQWGRAFTADRQRRHAEWHKANRAAITASGLPFTDRGETLLFRIDGKPPVDFYPSTGRWRATGSKRTHSGGARGFLAWFAAQPAPKAGA